MYSKFWNFRGTFPDVFGDLIDEHKYDKAKDKAIMGLADFGKDKIDKNLVKLEALQDKISNLHDIPKKKMAEYLGISERTIYNWRKPGVILPLSNTAHESTHNNISIGGTGSAVGGETLKESINPPPLLKTSFPMPSQSKGGVI